MATSKYLVILLAIISTIDLVNSQKRTKVGTSIAGSETKAAAVDFECPEEFGYYRHQTDCTRYYVCVFGGALEESCTGGLVYSHELQTCDWPRNVACITGQDQPVVQQPAASGRPTDSRNRKPVESELQGVKQTSQISNSNTNNGLNQLTSPISSSRGKTSESVSLPLELLDEDFTLQGNLDPGRQGRDFRGPGRGPNPSSSVQDSNLSFRNNIVSESRRTSSSTRQQTRVEDDFVPATTFNPALVTSNSGRFQNSEYEDYYDDKRWRGRPSAVDYSERNYNTLRRNDHRYWFPHRQVPRQISQQEQQHFREPSSLRTANNRASIPSMHFNQNPVQNQRSNFDPIVPVPVRGSQLLVQGQSFRNAPQENRETPTPFRGPVPLSVASNFNQRPLPSGSVGQFGQPGLSGRAPLPSLPASPSSTLPSPSHRPSISSAPSSFQQVPFFTQPAPARLPSHLETSHNPNIQFTHNDRPLRPTNDQPLHHQQSFHTDRPEIHNRPTFINPNSHVSTDVVPLHMIKDSADGSWPVSQQEHRQEQTSQLQRRPPVVSSTPITNTVPVRSQSSSQFTAGASDAASNFDFDEWGAQFTNRNPVQQQEHRPQSPRPVESHGQFLIESTPTQGSSKSRPSQVSSDSTSSSQPSRTQFERPIEQPIQTQRVVPSRPVQQQQQKQQFQSPSAVTDFQESTDSDDDFALYDGFTDDGTDTTLSSRRPFQQGTQVTDHTEDLTELTEPIVFRTTTTTTPAPTTRRTTTTETPTRGTASSSRGNTSSRTKTSDGSRGPSRFKPSAAETVEEEDTEVAQPPSTKGRRPTLKPVAELVPAKVETVDIFRHPPRRLEPIFPQPLPDEPAAKCNADVCRLPDCYCGGKEIPGGLKVKDVPQIVLLTFDDSVNDLNKDLYKDLFEKGRQNPNGCPIQATFYVSHEWTDYGQVQNLYASGHEIASHTISHSFGEQFSAKKWAKEASGQRDILAAYGGVRMEDIRGLRAPFLSIGGNKMFKMLYDMNFTYDSSMPVYENKPPSWPYTLDYKIFHDCMIPPCPTKSYPGVWEVPMVMWQDLNGGRCSMGDGCSNPPDAEGIYKMLIKNFERHYTTNRAPFPLYYHAAWFTTPHHKEGFEAFLDTIVAMDDVWLVTNWQAIQWVRDPTPLDRIKSFKPFQCDYPERPKRCNAPKVCNAWHKSGVRYMRTCQPCPEVFPWTGRTGVKNILLDQYLENDAS